MLDDWTPLTPAEQQLVADNLGFVRWYVRTKFGSQHPLRDDLEQAGTIGLMVAVRTHDPSQSSLETHASRQILDMTTRLLDANHLIHIPRHVLQAVRREDIDEDGQAALLALNIHDASGDDGMGYVVDDEAGDPAVIAEVVESWRGELSNLDLAMDALPDIDGDAIRRRFYGGESYKEIGEAHGKSREWARLKIDAALNGLREHWRASCA